MEQDTRLARRNINPDGRLGEDDKRSRPQLGSRLATSPGVSAQHMAAAEEDLIDFSEPTEQAMPWLRHSTSASDLAGRRKGALAEPHKHIPSPPPKPSALRSPSGNQQTRSIDETPKLPPPRPRKPSSAVKPLSPLHQQQVVQPSPLSQVQRQDSMHARPALPDRPNTYRGIAKQKIASVYHAMPSTGWHTDPSTFRGPTSAANQTDTPRRLSTFSTHSVDGLNSMKSAAPPPPPPRRVGSTQSFATIRSNKQQNRMSSSSFNDESGAPVSPGDGVSKKEFLWQQRLQRSRGIMERNGVTLRTWRVGSDIADVCVRLVEMELREIEKAEKR
jgi:hypothetical protein